MSTLMHDNGPIATCQKVMIATTAYDSPDSSYTFSIAKSREALSGAGIQSAYLLLSGNCHVDDARNSVVREFLASDCTDLMFLDADVSWDAEDLVTLCGYDLDLCGAVYPYRREILGQKNNLPYRQLAGVSVENGLLEVEGLPTGFMRIRRNVIETMLDDCVYNKDTPILFEREFVGDVRWSGDLNFCRKWRNSGGRIYAAIEIRLGHVAKIVLKDSLGASLRRASNTTLHHVASRIKSGTNTTNDLTEAIEFVGNHWGACEETLICAVAAARKADGDIIETGSGLTTVLMAAATTHTVWCLEHNKHFASKTRQMAIDAGVPNIAIVHCDIANRWYSLSEEDLDQLPKSFALGLNDGPPRRIGDRMAFFGAFGDDCAMILSDDADDAGYAEKMTSWAESRGRVIAFPEERSAIIMEKDAA